MDLRAYYKSIHDMEAKLPTEEVAVVSKATPDGGLEGVVSEMPRAAAAKLLIEDRVRLATAEEAVAYRKEMDERRRKAQDLALSQRVQVAVITDGELQSLKSTKRTAKD